MVTSVLEDGNTLNNAEMEDENMIDSTHVPWNIR